MVALYVNVAATWFMVGLIWTIQVVHYPLFASVGAERFVDYEQAHSTRITAVLAVPWGLEAGSALWLTLAPPEGAPVALAVVGLVLVAATAVITAAVHVPLHRRLGQGFDRDAIRRLVATNWWRTGVWTLHGVVAATMLALAT